MEKLVHLLWRTDSHDERAHRAHLEQDVMGELLGSSAGVERVELLTGDTTEAIPKPALVLGAGPALASVVVTWVRCIDDRAPIVRALAGAEGTTGAVDQFLVTESVPQPAVGPAEVVHFSWFPKPDRLTEDEFFHGWHEIHTPKTAALHPRRCGYVRDSVVRVLTPGSLAVRALVAERFPTVADYVDPERLYGSPEALEETMADLPLYADIESISSRPLREATPSAGR